MISPDDLRLYHRQATLYVLQSGERMTAAEIHEALTGMALSNGHPKECATITPAGVAGILRALQGEGLTAMDGERRNTRHGRAEPTWVRATMAKSVDAPRAPAARQTTRPSLDATDPMAGLSREQLLAMIVVGDELSAATARFQSEVEGIKERARRILAGGVFA